MEYKTEKDLTHKQNKIVYEEVYMDDDLSASKYIEGTGWNLKYPSQFSINHSKDKSIAPRRIYLKPYERHFRIGVAYYDSNTNTFAGPDGVIVVEGDENMTVLSFIKELTKLAPITDDNGNVRFQLNVSYDYEAGQLLFTARYYAQAFVSNVCRFIFVFPNDIDYDNFVEFMNQRFDSPGIHDMCMLYQSWLPIQQLPQGYTPTDSIILYNVWNRTPLYLHASFSNSKNHYLCLSEEHWERPGKLYTDNTYGSEFTVYYTTDGTHKIIPLYAHKIIELSFVLRTSSL